MNSASGSQQILTKCHMGWVLVAWSIKFQLGVGLGESRDISKLHPVPHILLSSIFFGKNDLKINHFYTL